MCTHLICIYIVERKGCVRIVSGEVEDVEHLLLRCMAMAEEREKLIRLMEDKVVEWKHMEDRERVAEVLEYACGNDEVSRSVERICRKRFGV